MRAAAHLAALALLLLVPAEAHATQPPPGALNPPATGVSSARPRPSALTAGTLIRQATGGGLESYVDASRRLLAEHWGERLPDWRSTVAGAPADSQWRIPLSAIDLSGDGREDALYFDVRLDGDGFVARVDLAAHDAVDGELLWRRDYGIPFDLMVLRAGDLTGDGAADLVAVLVERRLDLFSPHCSTAACAFSDGIAFTWTVELLSGPNAGTVWQRRIDGAVRQTGGRVLGPPASTTVRNVDGVDALFDLRRAGDVDGDGLADVVVNTHGFSGLNVYSQPVRDDVVAYSTTARVLRGASGEELVTRSHSTHAGAAVLLPAGDATGDGRDDLLWSVPTQVDTPCVTTSCIRERRAALHVELVDSDGGASVWSADLRAADLTMAAPVASSADLTGDARADVLVALDAATGSTQLVALSGADGAEAWRTSTVLSDPPTVLPPLDGGRGHDLLLWEGWEPDEEGVDFRVRLRRVDGATGRELVTTERDLQSTALYDVIYAYPVGDVDDDGVADIAHATWRYSSPLEERGTAETWLEVESGADAVALLTLHRPRKALLFDGGDLEPGGADELLEASTPYDGSDFRLGALDAGGQALWERTDGASAVLLDSAADVHGAATVLYSRVQLHTEAPRLRSRIDALDGATGAVRWSIGDQLP